MLARFPAAGRRAVRIERRAEVRYRGQSHELSLAAGPRLAARFHREHARRFGFADPARAVEVVTVEVRGAAPDAWPAVETALARESRGSGARGRPGGAGPAGRRAARAAQRGAGGARGVPVWARAGIGAGTRLRGPAIVIEEGATLWIAPGWGARLHPGGTLVLGRGGGR